MHRPRTFAFVLPVVIAVVVTAAQCTGAPERVTDLPECPHSWMGVFGRRAKGDSPKMSNWVTAGSPSSFLISREITDVPEFHDCQRRIVSAGRAANAYAPLGAIFARFKLDSVVDSVVLPQEMPRGAATPSRALTARLRETAQRAGAPGSGSSGSSGASVAAGAPNPGSEIKRAVLAELASEGVDSELGIKVGFNCLMVEYSATDFRASMVAMGTNHTTFDCLQLEREALPPGATRTSLSVLPQKFSTVPPAARWEWDANANRQLLGTKCAPQHWCTFGPASAAPWPTPAVGSAGSAGSAMSPGWYDQQFLADIAAAAPSSGSSTIQLQPSNAYSTVIPGDELSLFARDSTVWVGRWIEAAYVAMPEALALYASKLGLRRTSAPVTLGNVDMLNRVELCIGTMNQCGVTLTQISDSRMSSCSTRLLSAARDPAVQENVRGYWTRIIPPGAPSSDPRVRYHCTTYRGHPGVAIPAMVRWRWKADDETIWVYCPEGCCEVHSSPLM